MTSEQVDSGNDSPNPRELQRFVDYEGETAIITSQLVDLYIEEQLPGLK